jgi:dipeptidyl aminopeptidase/acylaminoacyl peptidase
MVQKIIAPFGSWRSPISTEDVYGKFIGIGSLQLADGQLFWVESRPDGHNVTMRRSIEGNIREVTPATFNVRSRVHEYGGGEYLAAEGEVFYSNFSDQHIYRQVPGEKPVALTHTKGMRYADGVMDKLRNRLIAVREDHTINDEQPTNTVVSIGLGAEDNEQVLVSGQDFYSDPRLSPDGRYLCWLTWNHPNMPWDGTELWVSEISADGMPGTKKLVAGGVAESIFQPEWSPDGRLYFVSDRSGWWNLYRWENGSVQELHPMEAEFGEPQWGFRNAMYALESADRLICAYSQDLKYHLGVLDTLSLAFREYELPYSVIFEVQAQTGQVFFTAGSATQPLTLVCMHLDDGRLEVIRQVREITIDPANFSQGLAIEFPTGGELTAHGFFYAPQNLSFEAPAGEKPPLLVMSHGGPTGSTVVLLRYGIQYWTSRGFAVLDVNYGGSTGYGRAYRERLKGQWGIVDVEDCVNGADFLVKQGLVDGNRLAITGGSAGGYTTLCALTFYNKFKAGASHYGIGDLEAMAKDTHKFESRYLDGLVGPYPEARQVYLARSPIHHLEQLSCPIILLQGLDDHVVPPNQAQMMYEAVRARGLPVAYLTFPGEGHGFVKFENNKRALEAELYFYARVFGFELAEPVQPVEIENLR